MNTINDDSVKEHLAKAINFYNQNNSSDAKEELRLAVSYCETFGQCRLNLFMNYSKKKSLGTPTIKLNKIPDILIHLESLEDTIWNDTFIAEFQKAISGVDKQQPRLFMKWKNLLIQQAKKHLKKTLELSMNSNSRDAYKKFAKVISYDENYGEAYFEWGKKLLKDGNQKEAVNKILKVFEVDPTYTVKVLIDLQSLQKLKWNEEFIIKIQDMIDNLNLNDNKNKAKIYYEWGTLLSQLNLSAKSIAQLKESVRLDPKMEEVKNWKAWRKEIAKANLPGESVQEYEQYIEKYNTNVFTYTELGNLFRCQSQFEKAMGLYKNGLKKHPICQTVHESLLHCLLMLHDISQVEVEANKLLEYSPENEKAYNGLIFAANLERDFKKAIEKAKHASEKNVRSWRIDINLAWALCNDGQNDEAIKVYEKLLQHPSTKELDKSEQAKIYFFYGNLLLSLKLYEDAGCKFQKATEVDYDCVYAHHNLASIPFEIQGQYEDASGKWDEALKVYERLAKTALNRVVDQKEVDSHEFYYHAQILQSINGNKKDAEEVLKKGLAFNPQDTLILSGLASLEWEKKGECLKTEPENASEKSACHRRAINYFKQAEGLLKKRLNLSDHVEIYSNPKSFLGSEQPQGFAQQQIYSATDLGLLYDDLIELANLYFIIDKYTESSKFYQKATDKNDKAALPYAKLGVIQLRLKKPKAAIPLLKKSLEINPDELDVRSSLAEAYLRVEKLEEADEYYREVLDIAPNHVQSLIGLGETYTNWGDKKETDRYSEAIVFLIKALDVAGNEKMRSKYLTTPEKAKVNYLLGYTIVQRYENSKLHHQDSELKKALKYFKQCQNLNPSYQKAIRAIDKLEKRSQPLTEDRYGRRMILGLSGLVFLLVQLFFYGPFLVTPPYWTISESSLKLLEKNLKSSDIKLLNLELLKDKELPSPEAFLVRLDIDNKISDKIKRVEVKDLIKNSTIRKPGDIIIDATSYSALTLALLMFMVVALYLPQVLKLSVAGISLEKSTLDQSQAGGSMGIAK